MSRKVLAKVISQEGLCASGHGVGDEVAFDWNTNEIKGKVCLHAQYSMLPKLYAMAHDADVAFAASEDGSKVARHACARSISSNRVDNTQ